MSPNVDLVVIGHLARNEDRTPWGARVSNGGSAYYCAVGASFLDASRVGLVAPVGDDYQLVTLDRLGVDQRGVQRLSGSNPMFRLDQHLDGSRSFTARWGVAWDPRPWPLPDDYLSARHVHLATAPPAQQLAWLDTLRDLPGDRTLSADMFEHFAAASPERSREVCDKVDLVFLNETEQRLLGRLTAAEVVVKLGSQGARYLTRGSRGPRVTTTPVAAVDTTGAGDLLAGAFLIARLAGAAPVEALAGAVHIATASVREFGVDGAHLRYALDAARQGFRRAADGTVDEGEETLCRTT